MDLRTGLIIFLCVMLVIIAFRKVGRTYFISVCVLICILYLAPEVKIFSADFLTGKVSYEKQIKEVNAKVNDLEEIVKVIDNKIESQPIYKYSKLSEGAICIIVNLRKKDETTFKEVAQWANYPEDKLKNSMKELENIDWAKSEGEKIKITKKGKKEFRSMVELITPRFLE